MSGGAVSQEAQNMLCRLLDQGQSLLALFDPMGRLCHANAAFLQAYDIEAVEALPSWADILRACHLSARGVVIEADDIEAWLSATASRRLKLRCVAAAADFWDGRSFWVQESLSPEGWLLVQGSDITSLRQERRARAAGRNGAEDEVGNGGVLAGLVQGRELQQLLQMLMAREDAWPMCVVALGLDEFEAASQEVDPALPEELLQEFALRLQASLRREDVWGRLSAREFLLVLPTAGRGQARAIAARLLQRVRQGRGRPANHPRALGCSAGLVEAQWAEPVQDLLARARACLHRAELDGGDRLADDEGGVQGSG